MCRSARLEYRLTPVRSGFRAINRDRKCVFEGQPGSHQCHAIDPGLPEELHGLGRHVRRQKLLCPRPGSGQGQRHLGIRILRRCREPDRVVAVHNRVVHRSRSQPANDTSRTGGVHDRLALCKSVPGNLKGIVIPEEGLATSPFRSQVQRQRRICLGIRLGAGQSDGVRILHHHEIHAVCTEPTDHCTCTRQVLHGIPRDKTMAGDRDLVTGFQKLLGTGPRQGQIQNHRSSGQGVFPGGRQPDVVGIHGHCVVHGPSGESANRGTRSGRVHQRIPRAQPVPNNPNLVIRLHKILGSGARIRQIQNHRGKRDCIRLGGSELDCVRIQSHHVVDGSCIQPAHLCPGSGNVNHGISGRKTVPRDGQLIVCLEELLRPGSWRWQIQSHRSHRRCIRLGCGQLDGVGVQFHHEISHTRIQTADLGFSPGPVNYRIPSLKPMGRDDDRVFCRGECLSSRPCGGQRNNHRSACVRICLCGCELDRVCIHHYHVVNGPVIQTANLSPNSGIVEHRIAGRQSVLE